MDIGLQVDGWSDLVREVDLVLRVVQGLLLQVDAAVMMAIAGGNYLEEKRRDEVTKL